MGTLTNTHWSLIKPDQNIILLQTSANPFILLKLCNWGLLFSKLQYTYTERCSTQHPTCSNSPCSLTVSGILSILQYLWAHYVMDVSINIRPAWISRQFKPETYKKNAFLLPTSMNNKRFSVVLTQLHTAHCKSSEFSVLELFSYKPGDAPSQCSSFAHN